MPTIVEILGMSIGLLGSLVVTVPHIFVNAYKKVFNWRLNVRMIVE